MFSRILCGVDFSDTSTRALTLAGRLATRFSADLSVLAVNDLLLTQAAAAAYDTDYLGAETSKELQKVIASALAGHKGRVDMLVKVGTPAHEILTAAHEWKADLVVVGTHGLSGYKKMFYGSVTESVLRRTDVPVLVTPPVEAAPEVDLEKRGLVLAPVDFGTHSLADARVAVRFAQATKGSLLLMHVVPKIRGLAFMSEYLEEQHRLVYADAVARMKELAASLEAGGLAVDTQLRVGDPSEEIATAVTERNVQLVVMGLGGDRAISPRPGSIAYRVMGSCRTPILCLPPRAATNLSAG